MNPTADCLFALVVSFGGPAAAPWVSRARASLGGAAFAMEFASVPRRLGKAGIVPTDADRAVFDRAGTPLPPGLTIDEIARMAMLAALPESEQEASADDCFRHGETRERKAVLRALQLLPRPERFVDLAALACRTHVLPVFEAIGCENPYPASFFPDITFYQLVLKALFLDVALARIVGLPARRTPELDRMVEAYAAERRAAGRSVPADIERHFAAAIPAQQRLA